MLHGGKIINAAHHAKHHEGGGDTDTCPGQDEVDRGTIAASPQQYCSSKSHNAVNA